MLDFLRRFGNFVPRVLGLFGQRVSARKDSGIMDGIMEFHFPRKRGFRCYCACLSLNGNRGVESVRETKILTLHTIKEGGTVALSSLVRSTPDQVVQFGEWQGTLCFVLGQDILPSPCLSPPRCINGYRQI